MAKVKKTVKPDLPYCPLCGSGDILFEARATWNAKKGDFDCFMEGGCDAWCEDCGEMISGDVQWGDPKDWEPREDDEDEWEDEDE